MDQNFGGEPQCNECPQPYSDDYMIFDEMTGRYILTAKYALDRYGIDLLGTINERNSANAQIAVDAFLRQVSNVIYNFIHSYTMYEARQDWVIAHNPRMRAVIQQAMGEQLIYMNMVGDLSRSTDRDKRALAIDENAKLLLINSGICYAGV